MPLYFAFLRGINVGGSGLLSMQKLSEICIGLGFKSVRTYIQSGNVIFQSSLGEKRVKAALEQSLVKEMGKPVAAHVRTASELRSILEANPFPDAPRAKVVVVFLSEAPPKGSLKDVVSAPGGEQIQIGKRELYIYYPNGIGRSKLRLPALANNGTARNINTLAKLVALSAD